MANHSFVTTKKWLTADKVELDLKKILQSRFGDKLTYQRSGACFNVGFEWPYIVPFWVENVHKLEFRNGGPDWCWWIQTILHNEFALLYDGNISDEGVNGKWQGKSNKYLTFKSYMESRFKTTKQRLPVKVALRIIKDLMHLMDNVPFEVKATYSGKK